ncbi:hypothetical protein BDZ89DRAFT_1071489 [Hymenopellis radicata]|nr:hypothetical protein BDZ89DRAFT_1071489 [Hymenopellis radicata]
MTGRRGALGGEDEGAQDVVNERKPTVGTSGNEDRCSVAAMTALRDDFGVYGRNECVSVC